MEALRRLPASGNGGFESFAANLLSAACKLPFVVAASGSQPTGDAIAVSGQSCIQAKRYRETTALNINDIVGNIYAALHAVPHLDVYVLAVTKDAAQMRQRIIEVEAHTGLDVVVLNAGDNLSPLGALSVVHWTAVRKFLPELDVAWDEWAARCATEPAVRALTATATAELLEGLRTQEWLKNEAQQRLASRFAAGSHSTALDAKQRIDLSQAIPRTQALEQLTDWWTQPKRPNGALEADEGFGKTWTAAAFALQAADGGTPVLWLESGQWSGCDSIESLVRQALGSILPQGDPRLSLFARKVLRLWRKPLLLVLDGVNEHRCFEAAQRLLRDYADHSAHYALRFRILFTTRPLEFRPTWDKALWNTCQKIAIDPFNDGELTAALARYASDLKFADLPTGLIGLTRVPRYFHLAIRLHERLRGMGEITKPLLLFADLLEKVEASAPSFRELYAGGNLHNAENILAYLASKAQAKLASGWQVSREHVIQCFDHLNPPLVELAERRVVIEQRPGSVIVSDQHVALGFALHLLHIGEQSKAGDIHTLADEIARELEPNREQDTRTEALYLALLLTCLRPPSAPHTTERLRSALFALWWTSHNSTHGQPRLEFWAKEDLPAYAQAVEVIFSDVFSAPAEESLISPLAKLWREAHAPANSLRPILVRWLALIYPASFEDDTSEEALERAGFPIATEPELLRLSAAALSIISQRPDPMLLPALARCARSMHFCFTKIHHNNTHYPLPHKDIAGVIGILLVWGLDEGIIIQLEALATNETNAGLLDGYRLLANLTQRVELPEILKRKPVEPLFRFPVIDNSPAAYRTGLSAWIARLPNSEGYWPRHNHLGRLAAYDGLANLNTEEAVSLADGLKSLIHQQSGKPDPMRAGTEGYKDMLPWLARARPDLIRGVHVACWNHYLAADTPDLIAFEPLVPLFPWEVEAIIAAITADPVLAGKICRADAFSTHFTTTVLISAEESLWLKWFDHLCAHPGRRYGAWEIIPAPYVLARVATLSFRSQLRQRYHRSLAEHVTPTPREAVFWLAVLASSLDPERSVPDSLDFAKWALSELRSIDDGDERIESFLRIVAGCRDAEMLECVLREDRIKRHLLIPRQAQTFGYFLRQPDNRKIQATYHDVAGQVPLNLARGFLLMASNDKDLVDYARAVAQAALARVTQPSERPPFGFVSEFSVDEAGDIEGWGMHHDQTSNSYAQHGGSSALWGVDRGSLADFGKHLSFNKQVDAKLAALNAELDRQNKRHENLPDSFVVSFQGSAALDTWERLFPDEYLGFVRLFTEKLYQDRAHLFDLGAFAYALLRPLCRRDLAWACQLHDDFFTRDVVCVFRTGAIPAFVADLWHYSLNDVTNIKKVRAQTILDSRNDLHVLWITLAAIIGGTLDKLEENIRRLSESDWGKDRALAVTMMAFTGKPHWQAPLKGIEANDESRMVRKQAGWSRAVLEETMAARSIWDAICQQPVGGPDDFTLLAARLIRLEPVLPVEVRWWPRPCWENQCPAADALLLAFLEKWKSRSSSRGESEIGNRKLKKFFCGLDLSRDHATRMAPWWTPI